MPLKDPEKRRAYQLAWHKRKYAEDPDYRAKLSAAKSRDRKDPNSAAYKLARTPEQLAKERDRNRRKQSNPRYIARHRAAYVKRKYGISMDDLNELLELQGHTCPICNSPVGVYNSCVDHCHTTGRVRGVLCRRCNTGLGLIGDTLERAEAAVRYLAK